MQVRTNFTGKHLSQENTYIEHLPCINELAELTKRCIRRLNEKWSDPDFNLESAKRNCLLGLVDDAPSGPNVDAVDLRNALGTLTSVPNLINPLGTMSLSALGDVLDRELPSPKSYPPSTHRVVSTSLIAAKVWTTFTPPSSPHPLFKEVIQGITE